jgi:hypothetical protein
MDFKTKCIKYIFFHNSLVTSLKKKPTGVNPWNLVIDPMDPRIDHKVLESLRIDPSVTET